MTSSIAAVCTLLIISITRVPAIHRQFRPALKENNVFFSLADNCLYKKCIYYILIYFNIAAGVFSSIGAYLGTITIIEFISYIYNGPIHGPKWIIFSQAFAIFIAISCFASYYSFNIHKAKSNTLNLIRKINRPNLKTLRNKNFFKTFMVSFLSVVSVPFIAYFVTKNAFYKMPYINTAFSVSSIQWIATFSALTALIACLTTNVSALHEFFSKCKRLDFPKSTYWASLRNITYTAGLVDSAATGLGSFLGVITISRDIFQASLYDGYILYIAIGCGISAALMNLSFSVRQGFNDIVEYYR